MQSTPLNHSVNTTEQLVGIGDEVQAELDRYMASRRGQDNSSIEAQVPPTNGPSEYGTIIGAFAGPFIYTIFVFVCQRLFAPELMADDQYGLMLMGTLPYGLVLGGYIGARLPRLLETGRWRSGAAWLSLMIGIAAMGLLSVMSGVARLYMPFYVLPVVGLLWIEVMNRHKESTGS